MASFGDHPRDLARRLASRRDVDARANAVSRIDGSWRRDTFRMPRSAAREQARKLFADFPKAAYMTEVEWWRECENGDIEFTIRRRTSAD